MKHVIVTTSWDDGHILDLRLADLLKKYGIKGTFYISPEDREIETNKRLNPSQIKKLARDFEIGSHTMTHPVLTKLTDAEIKDELRSCKQYLQELTGQPIKSFCYPRGMYDASIVKLVKAAGHTYARTTKNYEIGTPKNWLEAGPSIEVHRMALPRLHEEVKDVYEYSSRDLTRTMRNLGWKQRAMDMFDHVVRQGGIFHLWGHSWVIENEGKWQQLEEVLRYISARKGISYVTNGELVKEPKR
jgi:peptidoglycan/xylan/chitin deacetylase (PgdA/CDA1 family)